MKIIKTISLVLILSFLLTSCGSQQSSGSHSQSESPSVEDVLNEKTSESQNNDSTEAQVPDTSAEIYEDNNDPSSEQTDTDTYSKVDIDLTSMNSNMVYSEVYDMVTQPDGYLGKTVKMTGQFAIYEGQDRVYCACIVADATACCSQGIEFILEGEPSYPEGYPELGTEITVAGVFDTYIETMSGQDFTFIQLIDAELMT